MRPTTPLGGPASRAAARSEAPSAVVAREALARAARARRFAGLLARSDAEDPAASPDASCSGAWAPKSGAPWLRLEGPLARPNHPRELEAVPPPAASHRLLLGTGGAAGAEVRLSIASGPLAGSEIQLRAVGGAVAAALLTATPSSRQTLVRAMEEAARRLKRKGHLLRFEEDRLPDLRSSQGGAAP
jgi:hypothetical protein